MRTSRRRVYTKGIVMSVVAAGVGVAGCDPVAEPVTVTSEPKAETRPRCYELRIRSRPAGGTVRIDGEAVGTTPVTRRFKGPTALQIEITAPGHRPAALEIDADWWLRSAAAKAADRLDRAVIVRTFHARLEPVVMFRLLSEPAGAAVTINAKPVGTTPANLKWDGKQTLAVRFEIPGYAADEVTLDQAWWAEHGRAAVLDEKQGAHVVTVTGRLWEHATKRWTRVGHTQRSGGRIRLPVQRGSSRRTVPATVIGPTGRRDVLFLYDTGATYTTLDAETAREIGIDFSQASVEIETRTANGVVSRPLLLMPAVRIGQHAVRNVTIAQCDSCRNGEVVGLLGLNVLQEFSTSVSPDGRQMTLVPTTAGAGRMLSLKAFLDVASLVGNKVIVANKCNQPMAGVVLELVQREAAGAVAAKVRTPRFAIAAGETTAVDVDLSRLASNRPTEVLVVEGEWR